jgi:hypothetical protein
MHKLKKSKFLIIIPSYNEFYNLKKFVKKVKKIAPVCILDDCSNDQTVQWLKKNKINYIRNKKNLGYEKNLINGIKKLKEYCDYLVTFDGDGQHKYSDLLKIMKIKKNYDIIICNRIEKNRLMEILISFIFKLLYGLKDPLSGFKVYKTNILKNHILKKVENLFLIDLLFGLLKKKESINFPINTNKRFGNPKVGNTINVNLKELRILFKIIYFKFTRN